MTSKVDAALAADQDLHADDPERAEIIVRTRRFKSSWIELAEALVQVRKNGRWKQWGHETFEAYATKELHLRPETVEKLAGSYAFLRKSAPEVLRRDGVESPVPSYQAIDYLRRVEESDDAPTEVVEEVRKSVLDDCRTNAEMKRRFDPIVFPVSDKEKKSRDLAAMKNVATRLRDILAETRALPRHLAVETKDALDRLLEAVGEKLGAEEATA